ncbi:MAG: DUF4845 domain-containing protein [Aromatoleum sp.]|nr:DUF4845 domain-containing protein [Aromatoleum sp.]
MHKRTSQRGLTILGFLFVAAVVVSCAMIGFRVAPSYIEYYSVEKALKRSLEETSDIQSPAQVRNAFQRFADTGYIDSVRGADIDVQKRGNEITASVSWTRKLPLVANVSLFLEFDASATR